MSRAYILFNNYYSFEKECITIGGIQSYITSLVSVIVNRLEMEAVVLQVGKFDAETRINNCIVHQIAIKKEKNKYEELSKYAEKNRNNKDIIIYATDTIIPQNHIVHNSIAIQHGIAFDMPKEKKRFRIIGCLIKYYEAYQTISRIRNVSEIVCVDYNFPNWYRTQIDKSEVQLSVNPNFTKIPKKNKKPEDKVNIIFARRFYWYRGTRIFLSAMKRILSEEFNICVTIAGDGPDEELLKTTLSGYNNVLFTKYESIESLHMHSDKHIAVVPTVGSEGTSLSLLEAMASQCAVICTDVGGMTNIVVDAFNGLIVPSGNADELYLAIRRLIHDKKEREFIAEKGYETVCKGFSIEKWEEKWIRILSKYKA